MAGCLYRIANTFRVKTFCFGDLSLKCSSHVAQVTSRDADGGMIWAGHVAHMGERREERRR